MFSRKAFYKATSYTKLHSIYTDQLLFSTKTH